MRIAIIGAPRAGKTTLGRVLSAHTGWPCLHADDLIPLGWSAASAELARRLAGPDGDLILEGVAVVRGLRKALDVPGRPVDSCLVLARPWVPLSVGQIAMARGCATVLAQIEPELVRRGVVMGRP